MDKVRASLREASEAKDKFGWFAKLKHRSAYKTAKMDETVAGQDYDWTYAKYNRKMKKLDDLEDYWTTKLFDDPEESAKYLRQAKKHGLLPQTPTPRTPGGSSS